MFKRLTSVYQVSLVAAFLSLLAPPVHAQEICPWEGYSLSITTVGGDLDAQYELYCGDGGYVGCGAAYVAWTSYRFILAPNCQNQGVYSQSSCSVASGSASCGELTGTLYSSWSFGYPPAADYLVYFVVYSDSNCQTIFDYCTQWVSSTGYSLSTENDPCNNY
jgi:hypothetical protein